VQSTRWCGLTQPKRGLKPSLLNVGPSVSRQPSWIVGDGVTDDELPLSAFSSREPKMALGVGHTSCGSRDHWVPMFEVARYRLA
jgi:hypothetical protein